MVEYAPTFSSLAGFEAEYFDGAFRDWASRITSENASSDGIGLPNPVMLHCHFIRAEILHALCMGVVKTLMREWEELKRKDGKTDGGIIN
ncbi:hypothetical protein N7501_004869 [Penicillium viridicatum]|nr:hypothetical protein N7501_004869 [Penicillium viridicatum]